MPLGGWGRCGIHMNDAVDLVVGVGEVGGPLADLLETKRTVVRLDAEPADVEEKVSTMHVCFPYDDSFPDSVVGLITKHNPKLTVVHSTVVPGTTRSIAHGTGWAVAYSPIRGRHGEMKEDLVRYAKFFAAADYRGRRIASDYFCRLDLFRTEYVFPVEALELAKLVETSYSGLLIAWAQELERFCEELGVGRTEALALTEEVEYFPRYAFYPGHIKGHCIMDNLDLLEQIRPSPLIDAIRASNEGCSEKQKADRTRYKPRRLR